MEKRACICMHCNQDDHCAHILMGNAWMQAYSPLGSPGSWVKGEILKEPILIEIAEQLKKSPAQVALRWGIQSGHSVLPKSVNESRILQNLTLFDWSIPSDIFSKFSQIQQVYNIYLITLYILIIFRSKVKTKSPKRSLIFLSFLHCLICTY